MSRQRISLSLPVQLLAAFEDRADTLGIERRDLLEQLVQHYMEHGLGKAQPRTEPPYSPFLAGSRAMGADAIERIHRGQLDADLVAVGEAVLARLQRLQPTDVVDPPCNTEPQGEKR